MSPTSAFWKATFEGDSTGEQPLALLEIDHEDLAEPLRLVSPGVLPVTTFKATEFQTNLIGFDVSDQRILSNGLFTMFEANDFIRIGETNLNDPENAGVYQIREKVSGDDFLDVWPLWKRVEVDDVGFQSGNVDVMSQHVYHPFPFRVTLPSGRQDEESTASLVVDAVDRSIIDVLLGISSAPRVKIKMVLRSDPDTVEEETRWLDWSIVDFNARQISGELIGLSILNQKVSKLRKSPHLRPGIHQVRAAS